MTETKNLIDEVATAENNSDNEAKYAAKAMKANLDLNEPYFPDDKSLTDAEESIQSQGWLRRLMRRKMHGKIGLD